MKRAFTHKVESVPSCAADNDALAKLAEGKLPGEVAIPLKPASVDANRRARTSAAMIGLAISMGASSLLLPGGGDEVMAAEPVTSEPTRATPTAAEAAVVSPDLKAESQAAVSKPQEAESQAAVSNLDANAIEQNEQPGQNINQESPTDQVDAAAKTTDNSLNFSSVVSENQVLKVPPMNGTVDEVKAGDTVKNQLTVDAAESNQLYPSTVPLVPVNKSSYSAIPANGGIVAGSRENKEQSLNPPVIPLHLPVGQAVSINSINDLLKARQNDAVNQFKQNRLQNSLAELRSEESTTNTSEAVKVARGEFSLPLQLVAVADKALEVKVPVVTKLEKVANVSSPVIRPMPYQSKLPMVISPLAVTLPTPVSTPVRLQQPQAASPIMLASLPATSTNLVFAPVKTPATSATAKVPKPVVVEPQMAATPTRLYQVKTGDTLQAIAHNYTISPTQLSQVNRIDNPNLIQINQQLRIPPTKSITLVSDLYPTSGRSASSTFGSDAVAPSQAVVTSSTGVIPAVLKQPVSGAKSANTPANVGSSIVGTALPKSTLLVASESTQPSNSIPVSQVNRPIEKLKGDLLKLREQYQPQTQVAQTFSPAQATATTVKLPMPTPLNNTKPQQQEPSQTQVAQTFSPAQATATTVKLPMPTPLNNTNPQQQEPSQTQVAQASSPAQATPTVIPIPVPTPSNNTKPIGKQQPQSKDSPASSTEQSTASNVKLPVPTPSNDTKPQQQELLDDGDSQASSAAQVAPVVISVPTPANKTKPQEPYRTLLPSSQASAKVQPTHGPIAIPVPLPIMATAPVEPNSYNPKLRTPVGETVAPDLPPLQGPSPYLPNNLPQYQGFIWPTRGVVTSGYGWRWGRMHKGIDIAAPVGTPIFAAASGVVVKAGWNSGGYGNLVEIQHPDGSLTRYAHNSRILVQAGQEVQQGQEISEMGNTGHSTGPHCHFEVHSPGQGAVNPIAFLRPRS
ncbi:MAG TPA: peptidoglycan DD-metalloendopeptidase family protein [Candidatus Obscuribacterales bacterium]